MKGQLLISGGLLVGYCLAYPIVLAKYFYEKPQIDFVVFGVIFLTSCYIIWKNLSKKNWIKNLVFVLLILPLAWLKLEFWLYSQLNSPQFVTYILLVLLAGIMVSVLRFGRNTEDPNWISLLLIPAMGAGFIMSLFSTDHEFSRLLVLFFVVGLLAYNWEQSKMKAFVILVFGLGIVALAQVFESPKFFERQAKYHDKLVFSYETDLQVIDITEWRGNHWFYTDGVNQFSSIDSWLFYEPFVYPALQLAKSYEHVLVIGGENGMLVKELEGTRITNLKLIPIDKELHELAQNETLFTALNENSLSNKTLDYVNDDVFTFLNNNPRSFDLIFIDVADPIDLERNQYFTKEFYELVGTALKDDGLFVTQSGSPYFATEAFEVVQKTVHSAGFDPITFHNQILTLGEWSWIIGANADVGERLREKLFNSKFDAFQTQWLNQEAMQMMLSFGKPTRVTNDLQVNTMIEPTLYKYYLNGNYALK
ncbi:hypothetical protein [Roseivirga sp. E12]|uniref:spermine/spermidine synthase domain-containing protein n=1 Tax=Roseivirga sp. E12 TaxID=2819237 RepID=UPI001ABCC042|nr:hypothetical protein [Roseivirga sp. E12]MBO3699605.1 hypothetical protein [Roseivirga sp. E12]